LLAKFLKGQDPLCVRLLLFFGVLQIENIRQQNIVVVVSSR
jgi:hypothetical protein